jgi:uncharacterized protein (DUF58 family)
MSASTSSFKYLPASLAEAVHRLGIRVRRPVRGRGEGLHRSPEFGASVEFAEYRDYTPGDPPGRIDWNVYARSDRFRVRRFQEETSLRAAILLDTSESLAFRDAGAMTKWEYACHLAAGVMYALVRQGDTAALSLFAGAIERSFESAGTLVGLRTMLTALETLRPAGKTDIGQAMQEAAARTPPRSLVIVISDFLQSPEQIVKGMQRLHHDGHNLILLHVLDGGERRPAFGGMAELRELETGRRLVVDMDEIRAGYESAFERHMESLRRACADCVGDYHLVDTREPVESSLQRLGGAKA